MTAPSPPLHLRGLDGLRAGAVTAVILWHVALATRAPATALGALRPVAYLGWAGVDLFFALSGFLITTLLLREEAKSARETGVPRFSLRRFYVRRALRILPVFYVVFALLTWGLRGVAMFRSVHPERVAGEALPFGLLPYATFWSNYLHAWAPSHQHHAVTPGGAYMVFWSLCVEEHFYLLWPPALTLLRTRRARVIACLALCLALPALRFVVVHRGLDTLRSVHMISHYRFDALLWGALAALLLDVEFLRDRPRRLLLAVSSLGALAFYATGALSVVPVGTAAGFAWGLGLLGLACALVVLEVARRGDTAVVRALELAPLRWVGRLSYAMYLVHVPMIDVARAVYLVEPRARGAAEVLGVFVLALALTLAVAQALHVAVERPFLRLKDRFAG
ncbi:MAG: acyltransferase [Deltaproteobacteria bacterium]|nr:acyltransferase [Deltaproteobacteria bacterium]